MVAGGGARLAVAGGTAGPARRVRGPGTASGRPIAAGVIEGACRHLVQDRMGITGARWGLDGAQAMPWLRAIAASGDTGAYWAWHITQEHQRNHLSRYQPGFDLAA